MPAKTYESIIQCKYIIQNIIIQQYQTQQSFKVWLDFLLYESQYISISSQFGLHFQDLIELQHTANSSFWNRDQLFFRYLTITISYDFIWVLSKKNKTISYDRLKSSRFLTRKIVHQMNKG